MLFPKLSSIATRRKALGVSQQKLAKLVEISQSMLVKMERGTAVPSYGKAVAIFEELEKLEHVDSKTARDVMNKEVIMLNLDDAVKKATKLVKDKGISQFPVVDGGMLIGSITTKDLVGTTPDTKIKQVMGDSLPTIKESTSIDTVKELIKSNQAVLVVDRDKVVGIITAEDLV